MKRILLIATGMALATSALANEVLLCSDVPGCMEIHRANKQNEMLTDAEFKLKLSALHQEIDIQDHKHQVEVQQLKTTIEDYHKLAMKKEVAKIKERILESEAQILEAQILEAQEDRRLLINKIWHDALECATGQGSCTIPQ